MRARITVLANIITMKRRSVSWARLCVFVPLTIAILSWPTDSKAQEQDYQIAAGSLGTALTSYGIRTGRQILFSSDQVEGLRAPGLRGRFDADDALRRLLSGTRLKARKIRGGVFVLQTARAELRPSRSIPQPTDAQAPVSLDVVVITALKRETILADTPISLSVLDGSTLADRNSFGLQNLARELPGLNSIETGSGLQRLTVRGVYGTGEATVGVYYGETPVTAPGGTTFDSGRASPNIDLVDIDRVELLRGPQGSLYGASSMGGTLRILFHEPEIDRWSAQAGAAIDLPWEGSIGERLSLVLNAPVTGHLSVRAVGYQRRVGGYIDRPALGLRNQGARNNEGGRLALRWTPTDRLDVMVTGLIHHARSDDGNYWLPDAGRFLNDQPVLVPNSEHLNMVSGVARWNLGKAELTATASAYRWQLTRVSNYTDTLAQTANSASTCRRFTALPTGVDCSDAQWEAFQAHVESRLPAVLYQPSAVFSRNAELRLSSNATGPFDWTIGGFLEHRTDHVDSYALRSDGQTGKIITPFDTTGLRTIWTSLNQRSLFGEITVRAESHLSLIAGGRYYDYHRTAQGAVPVPNILTGTADLAAGPYGTSARGANLKFEAVYRANARALVYLQAAQGFRPGGINITPNLSDAERSYRADRLWSYELGGKFQLFQRALALDVAAYHIDWSDMIFSAVSENGAFSYNTNVGQVVINGAEMQLSWIPAARVEIVARASYVDARLVTDQTTASPRGLGRKGDQLPNVPHVTTMMTVTARPRLAADVDGLARFSISRTGPTASQFNPSIVNYINSPGYALADIEFGVRKDGWAVSVMIDNLFRTSAGRLLSNSFGRRQLYSVQPRTLSVIVSRSF